MITDITLKKFAEWWESDEDFGLIEMLGFYDDHNFVIEIENIEGFFMWTINKHQYKENYFSTRVECLVEALEFANDLFNDKYKENWN